MKQVVWFLLSYHLSTVTLSLFMGFFTVYLFPLF